jgi:gamma-glutamyltranspeptidase/glutathione hydrolase
MNNEMDDFATQPGKPNVFGLIQSDKNSVGPGKRPLSSMTPTIVLRDGNLFMVLGSPGGPTIINTVLGVVLNVTAFGMNGRQAVDAPRMHHQWLPDRASLEANALPDEALARLKALGHDVRQSGTQGDAHSIWIDPKTGVAYGINDKRSSDSKASAARK